MNINLLKEILNKLDTTKKYDVSKNKIVCNFNAGLKYKREIIFRNNQLICRLYVVLPNRVVQQSKFVLNYKNDHMFENKDLFLDALVVIKNFEFYELKAS